MVGDRGSGAAPVEMVLAGVTGGCIGTRRVRGSHAHYVYLPEPRELKRADKDSKAG
jgi:hypothetical protein